MLHLQRVGVDVCRNDGRRLGLYEQRDMTGLSYHHNVDSRFPLVELTLPQIYEMQAKRNNGRGIFWHRPEERMTWTEIYNKVGYSPRRFIIKSLKVRFSLMGAYLLERSR